MRSSRISPVFAFLVALFVSPLLNAQPAEKCSSGLPTMGLVAERTPVNPDRDSGVKLTYEDYCAIPEDGMRHEIIGGEHFVTPAPNAYHQKLVLRFAAELMKRVEEPGFGEVFIAPFDVLLSDLDVVQPDVLVVLGHRRSIITEKNVQGAPDLLIEILSPSTRSRDEVAKKALYERSGAREYWLVDPEEKLVEQYRLQRDQYELVGRHSEEITFSGHREIVLPLGSIW